jgi:ABC-type histidine transport system ATPase subunit
MTVVDNVAEALIYVLKLSKTEAYEHAQATLDKVGRSVESTRLLSRPSFRGTTTGGYRPRLLLSTQ